MDATEEIIVSGENYIERRIIVFPEQVDINLLQTEAYNRGYECGWIRGLVSGLAIIGGVLLFVWLIVVCD